MTQKLNARDVVAQKASNQVEEVAKDSGEDLKGLTLREKVHRIQIELKAPKGQFNKYGEYRYRSCEDILEAIKPLNAKYGTMVILDDELVLIGDRYYIKATATLTNVMDEKAFSTTAYAREELAKKGMDASQITGSASSYARKYALNGLLNIDDTKDADATNKHDDSDKVEPVEKPKTENVGTTKNSPEPVTLMISPEDLTTLTNMLGEDEIKLVNDFYKIEDLADLTDRQAKALLKRKKEA